MRQGKRCCGGILAGVLLALFLTSFLEGCAEAAPETIVASGTYTMGDGETMAVARERARSEAMRSAVEQAGVYLESTTVVRNLRVTEDEVRVLAGSILQVQDTKYTKKLNEDDSILFTATITAVVDPMDAATLQARLKEKTQAADYERLSQEYKKTQADYEQLKNEAAVLKQKLATAPTPPEQQRIRTAITQNEQGFSAEQWLEKGNMLQMGQHDYFNALAAYGQAIALNPQYTEAYIQRGRAYRAKGDPQAALRDYSQALTLDPQASEAYVLRAQLYDGCRRYSEAAADYSRALALGPQPQVYVSRGDVYYEQHQYTAALADYEAALAEDGSCCGALYGKARIYDQLHHSAEARAAYQQLLDCSDASAGYSYYVLYARKRVELLQRQAA